MKKIIWMLTGVAVVGLMIFKLASNKTNSQNRVYKHDKEKPVSVSVDTAKLQNIVDEGKYVGTFDPNKETKISADIQGKINEVLVDIGSNVYKGQKLIQLDNSLLKLQLETVEVQIEGLEDDVKRYTILTAADAIQGVQLEKAKLGLKTAKFQRATLLEQINKTSIKAPFNGVITAKLNEEGGFAAPGVPLLQLTDISTLRFTVNVQENDLTRFQTDQSYKISVDVFPDFSLTGNVTMIGSKANIGNNFPIQFQVANTKNLSIKSGMFGKVRLSGGKQGKSILIPTSAIIEENGISKVYVVKNGKAVLQTIETSRNIGSKTLVSNGLNATDVIVTNGFINLFEGANITTR